MSEPISGSAAAGAAGAAAFKALGGPAAVAGGASVLATIVVMSMMRPRSTAEWTVALISTVIGSLCGGAAVVRYLGIQAWTQDYMGLVAVGGLIFVCGLPAWAIVRWFFNYIEKRKDKDLPEIVAELADDARKITAGGTNG
jgi:hypothetical protein